MSADLPLSHLPLGSQPGWEGPPGQPLLARPIDVLDLLGNLEAGKARSLLLYAENLPPGFTDLSSGAAGEILQKLQQYRVRAAIVIDLAATPHSRHFADMVLEANRGRQVHFCADREAALAWLHG